MIAIVSCEKKAIEPAHNNQGHLQNIGEPVEDDRCFSHSEVTAGGVYYSDNKTWLWGDHLPGSDFDVTGWSLNVNNLKSGLGREFFQALVEPQFVTPNQYPIAIDNNAEVILVRGSNETKIYSLDLLIKHEIINDVIDGTAIMIAYCPLADLKVVYERNYCDTELVFAPSGYTYAEEGIWQSKQGFILWDRNTESLWWPLINTAVSNTMQNTKLKRFENNKWEVTTYGAVVNEFGDFFSLLSPNQNIDLTAAWHQNLISEINCEE